MVTALARIGRVVTDLAPVSVTTPCVTLGSHLLSPCACFQHAGALTSRRCYFQANNYILDWQT